MTNRCVTITLGLILGVGIGCSDRQATALGDAGVLRRADAATKAGTLPDAHVATDAGMPYAAGADAGLINAPNNPFPCIDPVPAGGSFEPEVLRCANGLLVVARALRCQQNTPPISDACFEDSDCEAGRRSHVFRGRHIIARAIRVSAETTMIARVVSTVHMASAVRSDSAIWSLVCQKPN